MPIDPDTFNSVQIFSDRLDKSVANLAARLDLMPTRREIDILNEHLTTIRSEFDKFVLRTEFVFINAENDRRFNALEVKTMSLGHFPAWATSIVVGVVLNVAAVIAEHFFK